MSDGNVVIRVENLSKIYNGRVKAVDNVSFEVYQGEIFGFLGPNGAGKTTTISILTTLIRPTSGRAIVGGYDVLKDPGKVRSIIGLIPQDIAVDDDLTGRENLYLQASLYHVPKDVARKRIDELLEMVDLVDAADRRVETYSGGMRRRLEIAGALIHRPKILFLDEPTLGLDVHVRNAIWQYIKKLKEEHDMTIFLTTHYMDEADMLCDRIAIIDYGRIKAIGTPRELKDSVGGDIIEVEVSGLEAPDKILRMLREMDHVRDVSIEERTLRIKAEMGERVLPKIIMMLDDAGVGISSVNLKKPSLDEVFLEYTGRRLRDEHGSWEEMIRQTAMIRKRRR